MKKAICKNKIFIIGLSTAALIVGTTVSVKKLKKESYDMGYSDCEEHYADWVDENISLQNRVRKLNKMIESLKANSEDNERA